MSRLLYLLLGFSCVVLAALGVFLPVLPTTPFLLVAAACFAKSSTRYYNWLIQNRIFGPIIYNWQQHRCIPLRAKRIAVTSMVLFGGYALLFAVPSIVGQIFTALLLLVGLTVVLSIKTCPK